MKHLQYFQCACQAALETISENLKNYLILTENKGVGQLRLTVHGDKPPSDEQDQDLCKTGVRLPMNMHSHLKSDFTPAILR